MRDILGIGRCSDDSVGFIIKDEGLIGMGRSPNIHEMGLRTILKGDRNWAYSEPKQLILPMVFL